MLFFFKEYKIEAFLTNQTVDIFFRSNTDVLVNKTQCYTGKTCQYFERVEPSERQIMISTKLSHREHKKSSCDVIKSLS